MTDQGFRDFHRIVKTNPATRVDFLSNKSARQKALLEASCRGAGGPAVAEASALDESAEHHEGGGQEEVEVHDRSELLGAASELAVAVHPVVRPLHDPARTGLDRGRDALAGDGAVEAEGVQQGPCGAAV